MSLTDAECRKAQSKDKQYRLSDSHGLSLIITTKGQKYWNVRYTVHGQRQSESLGPYPDLSLKKAREMAYELKYKHSKSVLHEDIKPFFKEVAEDWFENQKETWSPKHISNVRASLDELYIALANKRINQIQAPQILQIIKKIEARGSLEVAKRTLSRCGMVMKYAIAHGYRYDNPAGDLVYALKNKRVKNLASLTASEMPEFLKKVRAYPSDAQTHHAIILIMLTGVRVSELLQARWEEFDLEGRKWDIPEERMKNRLPHRVPLTDMMIAELQALRLTHNQELLFPYCLDNREPMRSESILAVIKRSGYAGRMTTHGFRSLFSTVVNETNLFNPDAIERQLAHVPQNRIRSAYNTLAIALRGQSSSTGVVKVPHSTKFDAGKVKQQLGISVRAWEEHMYEMKSLTQRKVTQIEAKAYFDVVFDNNSLCPIQQDEGIIQFYRNIATQVNSATKAEKKTEPNMDVPCLKS